jgi:hypothetical protein
VEEIISSKDDKEDSDEGSRIDEPSNPESEDTDESKPEEENTSGNHGSQVTVTCVFSLRKDYLGHGIRGRGRKSTNRGSK